MKTMKNIVNFLIFKLIFLFVNYDKVLNSSNAIKSIPEVNEFNETLNYSRKNSKNISNKLKRKPSELEDLTNNGSIKFDLIKMQSISQYNYEDELNNGNKDSQNEQDYNIILEMKTFSEFKNYETENSILNHIKKLFDNMNEKIFKIFFDFFYSLYPEENEFNINNTNSPLVNKNNNRSKTKLRGMLLKKNDDGIMSYLFIREEFEKILKEKENMINDSTKNNLYIEDKLKEYKLNKENLEIQLNELKNKINKNELLMNIEYFKNIQKESIKFF